MSIAFQNHADISSRHLNPYVGYESTIKVDDVFKPPVQLERKQSCDTIEDENVQASDVIESGEDMALVISQRNSVITSPSPSKITIDLESRKPSTSGSGSKENAISESPRIDDSESSSDDNTYSSATNDKNKSSNDVTADPTGILENEGTNTSDFEVDKGFVNDIHAHKVVLAACSPYFYKVLENEHELDKTSELVNDYHRVIDLGTSVTASGLQCVVECMYTSTISLSQDTVQDILKASAYLDMQLVVQTCLGYMKKWKADDVTRKQYVDDRRHRCSSEESVNDLKATAKASRRSRQNESNPEGSNAATTSVLAQSLYDTEGDAIYQGVSRQESLVKELDSQFANSTDISNDIANERSVELSSSPVRTKERSAPQTVCAIDLDDDVFVKKESSPSTGRLSSADSGLHDSSSSTPSTPGTHDAIVAAEALRRRHSELYRQVLTNSPYLLNPEAMAAAVAMTSLTSPLRSPSNQTRFPMSAVEQPSMLMNTAWHHIFGNSIQPALHHSNAMHCRPGHLPSLPGGLQPSQYMDLLQQHRMRQQAVLSLSGSAPNPPLVDSKLTNQYSSKIRGSAISPPYNPMMLSRLLQSTHDLPRSRSLKRSLSTNSVDHQALTLDKPSLARFSREKPAVSTIGEEKSFSSESTGANFQSRPPKRRRSTSSRSGSPDRPYKCMVCAAEFNRPANLKTHMRIHSGEKPYKCQSCGARFVQVAHLRAHILIHTGEKPYPCKVCGTRFRHLQTLKSHFRIHTGEKPYACEECQVKFRHKSQLRLHLRTKHGINTNTKKTYQQVPGLNSADISAHIKRTQEAVRMQSNRREF